MKNFFDTMMLEILPSLRALMARKLLENGFSQKEAANLLGLTQPAISHYKRNARGCMKESLGKDSRIIDMVNSLAKRMASGQLSAKAANLELFSICRDMLDNGE